jgi:hypothetical protein
MPYTPEKAAEKPVRSLPITCSVFTEYTDMKQVECGLTHISEQKNSKNMPYGVEKAAEKVVGSFVLCTLYRGEGVAESRRKMLDPTK